MGWLSETVNRVLGRTIPEPTERLPESLGRDAPPPSMSFDQQRRELFGPEIDHILKGTAERAKVNEPLTLERQEREWDAPSDLFLAHEQGAHDIDDERQAGFGW